MAVRFVLNGTPLEVTEPAPHVSLLQWLRSAGYTGTKEGCAEGECGACAVALLREGDGEEAARFESVNSCLVPLAAVQGRSLITVEGVAEPSGALHPVQEALVAQGGSQCGYCTPGFVVSLFCEYYRPERSGYDAEAISGNLCRCTGYRPIRDAARSLQLPQLDDPRLCALKACRERPVDEPAPPDAPFQRPTRLADVFAGASADSPPSFIAGGTDLMVYANQRYTRWPSLVSLEGLSELKQFACSDSEAVLGAGLTLSELERRLTHEHAGKVPMLEQLLPLFSSRLIRNRATLGGNLATASPIGDAAPALLALDAELTLESARGQRVLPLSELFLAYRKTALMPGELIVSVHLKLPLPRLQRFYKVSKRVLDDISTVAAGFALELDERGHVRRLRLAYGGIAATPVRALLAEQLALGKPWDEDTLEALMPALSQLGTPMTDARGSAAYRKAMVQGLLRKFFSETTQVALEATP